MGIFSENAYSDVKASEDIIKVGIYESEPYYSIDSEGNVSGYYDEFLKLLQEKCEFQYEYVVYEFEEGLKALEASEIDIMFGVSIKPERLEDLIFSKNFIAREKFSLVTNKDFQEKDLKKLDGIRIGLVEGIASSEKILNLFETNDVKVEPIFSKSWKGLEALLKEDKVDLILHNAYKENEYKSLYEFPGDQVYIAANKNKSDILENMDKVINEFKIEGESPIAELYNKYFNEEYDKSRIKEVVLFQIIILLTLLIIIFLIIPPIKRNRIKNKIRVRMNNNKYLVQYQPIFNPRNNSVVGFEGLLRLLGEDNKLIPPYKFIDEIEKNNMLFEVSLWLLEKVVKDYDEIKDYQCVKDREFYISLNLSLNEIENEDFVKKAIEILYKSNLGTNKICFEIIERVKMNDIDKIVKNISILKEAGFKIAIDDFGVEYSNLDILHKLDSDVIKVDKHFVDGIGKDMIRNEIILFISRIAQHESKSVVLEGVEEAYQDNKIKEIANDSLYVQGYFYNKPIYKEDIKKL